MTIAIHSRGRHCFLTLFEISILIIHFINLLELWVNWFASSNLQCPYLDRVFLFHYWASMSVYLWHLPCFQMICISYRVYSWSQNSIFSKMNFDSSAHRLCCRALIAGPVTHLLIWGLFSSIFHELARHGRNSQQHNGLYSLEQPARGTWGHQWEPRSPEPEVTEVISLILFQPI